MSESFHFWTHGVNVIPEETKEYTGVDNGLFLRRTGFGAEIRQRRGTSNWFHLPIPSATRLDGDNVRFRRAWLQMKIDNGPVVDQITIHAANAGNDSERVFDTGIVSHSDETFDLNFNLGINSCRGPLVMCVHAKFLGEGAILINGAGVLFEEL